MAIDRSPNSWSRSIVFSVAIHFAAVAWMGVSYAPENAREAGPVVMWLATVEQEPGAGSQEPEGLQIPSDFAVEPKNAQEELSGAVFRPVIDEPVTRKMETQMAVPTTVEENQAPEMVPEPETVVEDVSKPDPEMNQRTEPVTVTAERVPSANSGLITQNPELKTRNPTNAMLAFVGDPSTLGIGADEVLDSAFVKAEVLALPEPSYPPLSRKRGEEGTVVVKVGISSKGGVRSAEVVSSSNYERLDRAALAVVEQASFSPATKFGMPVVSERMLAYRFRLTEQ